MLFTDANLHAYFGVLTKAVESPEDLRLVAFTLGQFSEMQWSWSATEKEAYAIYQSILNFDLYLRGAKYVLQCDHKLLESILSKGITITKLKRWSMELSDYKYYLVHMKGKCNILTDIISRLKSLNRYEEPLENPEAQVGSNPQTAGT